MNMSLYYFYNQLNEVEKRAYDEILAGILLVNDRFQISETNNERIGYVMKMIRLDHPEIFWWLGASNYTMYNTYTICEPQYNFTKHDVAMLQRRIESVTIPVLQKAKMLRTEYDKIKFVFDYLVDTVEYVHGTNDQTICGSLLEGKCVCAGYANGMQYLLQKLGIECLYIRGVCEGKESHAWNIVKCDGKYYQTDVTFGDRSFSSGIRDDYPVELEKNYAYLCTTDARIYRDRQPNVECKIPKCVSDDLNYFKRSGRYYTSYSQRIWDDIRTSIDRGEKVWECQFEYIEDFYRMLQAIDRDDMYADIVGEHLQKIGYTGTYATITSEKEEMSCIACWF